MKTLQEDLKTGNFKHCYLLYGEEPYLVQQYKTRLKNALSVEGDTMNTSVFSGKDIRPEALIDLAETLPFFAERRVILVENSGFFKKSTEELAAYMTELPETSYFIFAEEDVDKRGKMYKQVKKHGSVVEFKRQTDAVLMQWILGTLKKENKKITRSVMELFLSKTGNDMELITQELEKLLCYTMEKDIIEAEDVEAICANQISGKIFDMVEAIGRKESKRALDLYYDLLMLKEPAMRILFLVTRHFQILMQLSDMMGGGFDYKSMASKVGVPEFAVRKYTGQARAFEGKRLEQIVRECVQTEENIKTGQMADQLAVELLIISSMG